MSQTATAPESDFASTPDAVVDGAPRDEEPRHLVKLTTHEGDRLRDRLFRALAPGLEKLLAIDKLNETFAYGQQGKNAAEFTDRALAHIGCRWRVPTRELERIPKTGPLIVVANHPFGAVEGLILGKLLLSIRPDAKLMANFLLGRIPRLRDLFILVDPFNTPGSAKVNVGPLRQSIRHLRSGGVLGVFPAGEVAHFQPSLSPAQPQVVDPEWNPTVARIIRMTGAPVLPIYFDGANSPLFQVLGLIHPRVRTAMLARELYLRRNRRIEMRVGSVIPSRRLAETKDDRELTEYLRHRTYLLKHRPVQKPRKPKKRRAFSRRKRHANLPIAPAVKPSLLVAEIEALRPSQCLVSGPECEVYIGQHEQMPHLMRELGRLRELTFRAVGEGTGRAMDIDGFDRDYLHLFVWNKLKQEVVGAYRIGQSDVILARRGRNGLYTSTLFELKPALLNQITPALELGRSFVRPEYQRAFTPLLLLWKGIGAYLVRNPQYRYLFGPVSISNDYHKSSKTLMVDFLKDHHCPPDLEELVQAKNPYRRKRIRGWHEEQARTLIRDSDDVSDLVADLEPDAKGLPVLLRQYLKLGAKLVSFNVDKAFSDCVDGLIIVDLAKTDGRILQRYLTKEGLRSWRIANGIETADEPRAVENA